MKVHINCQVKNEEILLQHVLPFWQEYSVDKFVFVDDGSTDNTADVIQDLLGPDAVVLPRASEDFHHEAACRSSMLEYSRSEGADIVISIDADELLSHSFLSHFDWVMSEAMKSHLFIYQYNVVGSLKTIRQDPEYVHNYRDFIFPMAHIGKYDPSKREFHDPRTPQIDLPSSMLKECGFIHLQALNLRYYTIKQLWYKVLEYHEYGKPVDVINNSYDKVVNGLNFCEIPTPGSVIGDWEFDSSIFDTILDSRGYLDYIHKYGVDDLYTFGREFI